MIKKYLIRIVLSLEEIRKLILIEINPLKVQINTEEKYALMEESLQFHTKKHDDLLAQHQSFNKYLSGITKEINLAKS